ncbi:MAG: type ISP restriction/modification enzyme [Egibacteraceae bacterium]
MAPTTEQVQQLITDFGRAVAAKFATGAGEPEDHLRGPVEELIRRFGESGGVRHVTMAGEDRVPGLGVRPDFAVYVDGALMGFVETKAPGKGADPRRFREPHDKRQWDRLQSLPNLLYTDGGHWGLYRFGERQGDIAELDGQVKTAGRALRAPDSRLAALLEDFLLWEPPAPRNARELALTAARLCRLVREEVRELLAGGAQGLRDLAADWRDLLFADASDEVFADGYAQTVTFALLLARVEGIAFDSGDVGRIADQLGDRHTMMGAALDVLTDRRIVELAGSLRVLLRVLSVVDWETVSRGDPDKWLLFYEDFLAEYDPKLRRQTGSYYTPNQVVDAMVRLVDGLLRDRLGCSSGFAGTDVAVVDPAVGTGTFLFRIIDRIARTVAEEEGEPEIPTQLRRAASRLVGFELQTGPYSVAEFRLTQEYARRGVQLSPGAVRLHVANTLEDPYAEQDRLAAVYEPIARSRRQANEIKRDERVLVVIGNPPYRERSRNRGGWVERGRPEQHKPPILADFMPPKELGVSAHVKHLYNPYVYFWRWATWKVFEHHAPATNGVVALITVAGFLNGPGFAAMRAYLRRVADAVWVIDLSPEGHQPPVNTRVFTGVQQPVCITIALKDGSTSPDTPAPVRHLAIAGLRDAKFAALAALTFDDPRWQDCPTEWTAPLLPAGQQSWAAMPALEDLLPWSGSGTMPGRTWVCGPSKEALVKRWDRLVAAPLAHKRALLDEHPQDRTIYTILSDNLPGFPPPKGPLAEETGPRPYLESIGYRSFDRQYILTDKRLINRPNPALWEVCGIHQVYLTALNRIAPWAGPAATFTALVPNLDHYHGRGGRAFPLWRDSDGSDANVAPGFAEFLSAAFGCPVDPRDVFAYLAAILAHPGYVARFAENLRTPGLRVPVTADPGTFADAVQLGRRVLWLHTYGERFVDAAAGRPSGSPKLPTHRRPRVLHTIPPEPDCMPETIEYLPDQRELRLGVGVYAPVEPAAWAYQVSGMRVIRHWFGYRKRDPEGRRGSDLDRCINATAWDPEWTRELFELVNVLTLLADLEPQQATLLDRVLTGPLASTADLAQASVLPVSPLRRKPPRILPPEQDTILG